MADLVLGAARLPFDALRPFGFAAATETGAHKLFPSVADHGAGLGVTIHPLSLKSKLAPADTAAAADTHLPESNNIVIDPEQPIPGSSSRPAPSRDSTS